ncbi:MAG TPA: MATE family efflux transporter, partial [Clostridiales bacterium]|nr:MATE family efflux transporter [Clostridiales bacterium]
MTQEKAKKSGTVDMLNGPFIPKILSFAIPVMLTGFLQLLYSSADLVVVGQFSEHKNAAQAAISSTSALINLIINLFMGLAVGINVAVAKRIGSGDSDGVKRVIHTSAIVGLIGGILVGGVGFFFARTFLEWMACPEDVIDLAALYMKIYFIGAPFNLLYNFFASVLRAKGETKKPFAILAAAGIVNIILNLIFVIGFKMSVDGVAIATIISQAVSAILVMLLLVRSPFPFKLSFNDLKIDKNSLADILKIGIPAGIQGSMFSISNVIIQSTINSFGSIVVAGNGNAVSIEGFLNVAVDAVYQATVSFIGQNYGAVKKKNIVKISIDAMLVCTAV